MGSDKNNNMDHTIEEEKEEEIEHMECNIFPQIHTHPQRHRHTRTPTQSNTQTDRQTQPVTQILTPRTTVTDIPKQTPPERHKDSDTPTFAETMNKLIQRDRHTLRVVTFSDFRSQRKGGCCICREQ